MNRRPANPAVSEAATPAPQVQALVSYLEHDPQPMIVLDPAYNILAANTAYKRQFATADKPYVGHKCYRVSHRYEVPCDQAGEHCPMKRAFEAKGPDRVLHIHHTPRGPEHVDVELRPILDERHEVVAYGANARKPGLVETAGGGTLFLDEIGDVPLAMQVKLLRLIESGTYRRVGGVETLKADFRLVAATHKPLREMVADGRFRQDLYYRISAFPIVLPPLRERRDDIPLLIESFLQRAPGARGRIAVDAQAMAVLKTYAWPGNIRELRNVLDRARLFADDAVILIEHLPEAMQHPAAAPQAAAAAVVSSSRARARREEDELRRLVALGTFTRLQMAGMLGLSERTVYRRLRALGLV